MLVETYVINNKSKFIVFYMYEMVSLNGENQNIEPHLNILAFRGMYL